MCSVIEEVILKMERELNNQRASAMDIELKRKNPDAFKVRMSRRMKEMQQFGEFIRPGKWDSDLDKYQEGSYTYPSKVEGYQVKLSRNISYGWNAYVILPEGHPLIGFHYDDIYVPFDLTFGSDNVFGFDHMHSYDDLPRKMHTCHASNYYSTHSVGDRFMTHENVREEAENLASMFADPDVIAKSIAQKASREAEEAE
jgi:hypothetical protein